MFFLDWLFVGFSLLFVVFFLFVVVGYVFCCKLDVVVKVNWIGKFDVCLFEDFYCWLNGLGMLLFKVILEYIF